ncbi:hypothetical protein AABB24_005224 [Solanum stoloniferum]|uniref:Integrase catalytic domain-containing protein n=1 Tax=Solanum stoloniferum TaxID=62892 RepID=A0ABD2UY52_9SOLN
MCVLHDLCNGKVIGTGNEVDGLYFLRYHVTPLIGAVSNDTEDQKLWHLRLGHPSVGVMKHMFPLKNKVTIVVHQDCSICPLAKQCRLKFHISSSKSSRIFELIHLYVWGPHRFPTYDGKHYFLTIVEDYSRFTWVLLLQSKKEVVVVLKNFISMVCNQFGVGIKNLRSDNGTEFFNVSMNALLAGHGIIHQSSCPYTPQQNGVVERKHRHILEMGRALKIQSHIPRRFWGDCIMTDVHLINRLPSFLLKGKSSYEVLFHKSPNITYLKMFGCLCFATVLKKGDKFAPRAKKAVFIGYSSTHKGYRLYDLEAKSVFISRDATFKEQVFPFQEKEIPDHHLPLLSPFVSDTGTMTDEIDVYATSDQPVVSPVGPASLIPAMENLSHEDITL